MESRAPDTNYEAEVNEDIHDNPSSHHNEEDDDRSQPLTGDGASPGLVSNCFIVLILVFLLLV